MLASRSWTVMRTNEQTTMGILRCQVHTSHGAYATLLKTSVDAGEESHFWPPRPGY